MDKFIIGTYNEENALLKGLEELKQQNVKVHDVYTPYPIHQLDELIGIRRSRLPIVSFCFGVVGIVVAVLMQYAVFSDWPLNVGGKPSGVLTPSGMPAAFWDTIPGFIPIIFEVMVLFAAFSMVGFFFLRNKLFPKIETLNIAHERATNDLYAVAVKVEGAPDGLDNLFRASGAVEVNEKEVAL